MIVCVRAGVCHDGRGTRGARVCAVRGHQACAGVCAFRVGESVRFRLDEVLAAGAVDSSGEGRNVQLTVLALTIVFGERFPRTPLLDLGSITFDEMEQLKKLCTAYQADLESMETPEECAHYCEGVIAAARLLARGISLEPPDDEEKKEKEATPE